MTLRDPSELDPVSLSQVLAYRFQELDLVCTLVVVVVVVVAVFICFDHLLGTIVRFRHRFLNCFVIPKSSVELVCNHHLQLQQSLVF